MCYVLLFGFVTELVSERLSLRTLVLSSGVGPPLTKQLLLYSSQHSTKGRRMSSGNQQWTGASACFVQENIYCKRSSKAKTT
jgi:hypothetical protein